MQVGREPHRFAALADENAPLAQRTDEIASMTSKRRAPDRSRSV
jgi:hypothetical protein